MDGIGSPFQRAMSRSDNRTRLATNALLAWVAASDGNVTANKHNLLRKFAGTRAEDLNLALDICREVSPDDLIVACEVIHKLPAEGSRTFMNWAIAVATADGRLEVPANFLLRFFADLTQIDLEETYQQVTKRTLPLPGDPSSVAWWQDFESKTESKQGANRGHSSRARKSGMHMTEAEALTVLGLKQDASEDEITKAFRKLAAVHHPDRFSQASENVQRNASKKFARIRKAFETLAQQ